MDVYWSVERCRWEPSSPEAEAMATPWSMWRTAPEAPEADVPLQRKPQPAPADA